MARKNFSFGCHGEDEGGGELKEGRGILCGDLLWVKSATNLDRSGVCEGEDVGLDGGVAIE